MNFDRLAGLAVALACGLSLAPGQVKSLTFSKDVGPLVKKYCLPCHSADNDNSSELILDSYDTLREGGKHGDPLVPGKPKESNLYKKLLPDPEFGRQMPRGKGAKPTEDEIKLIYDWIQQGAKKD